MPSSNILLYGNVDFSVAVLWTNIENANMSHGFRIFLTASMHLLDSNEIKDVE